MKSLTRDVLITLSVKIVLLTALWCICVKDVKRPRTSEVVWMLGSNASGDVQASQ